MNFYNVVVTFTNTGAQWRETWYAQKTGRSGADTAESIADTMKLQLVGPALAFRHPNTVLKAISVRDVSGNQPAAIRKINAEAPGTTSATRSPDVAGVSALVALGCQDGGTRHMWIRGLDDSKTVRDRDNGVTIQGPMGTQIIAYLKRAYDLGAMTRVQVRAPVPPSTPRTTLDWQNVLSFGKHATNPNWTTVRMIPGTVALPTAGNHVYFRGLDNPQFLYLRGRFTIVEADIALRNFTIPAKHKAKDDEVYVANTQWRYSNYNYSQWVNPQDSRPVFELVTRKTATPTDGRRGRRSPVIRRR